MYTLIRRAAFLSLFYISTCWANQSPSVKEIEFIGCKFLIPSSYFSSGNDENLQGVNSKGVHQSIFLRKSTFQLKLDDPHYSNIQEYSFGHLIGYSLTLDNSIEKLKMFVLMDEKEQQSVILNGFTVDEINKLAPDCSINFE